MTTRGFPLGLVAVLLAFAPLASFAQDEPAPPAAPDADLMERIRSLEEKVKQLESEDPAADEAAEPGDEEPEVFEAEDPEGKDGEGAKEGEADEEDSPLQFLLPKSTTVKLGGALRLRGQWRSHRDHNAFTSRPEDFVEMRTRIHLDINTLEHLRVFVELQDSRLWGETGPGLNAEGAVASDFGVHIRQAFIDFHDLGGENTKLTLRIGRFAFPDLGNYRNFSSLDWHNVTRSLDGAQVIYEPKGWMITAFGGNVREDQALNGVPRSAGDPGREALDSAPSVDDDNIIMSFYGSCRLIEGHEIDAHLTYRDDGDLDREEVTVGTRFAGKVGVFDYQAEGIWQGGEARSSHIDAWAAAVLAGLTLQLSDDFKLWFGTEYTFASGDRDATDKKVETYRPIYPFGHFYLGHMDEVAWRNIHALKFMLRVEPPVENLKFFVHFHTFWLHRTRDQWYSVNDGTSNTTPGLTSHRHLGHELDLFFKYKLWDRVYFWGGYSHWFDGRYVRKSQADDQDDMDWLFMQVEVKF